jgi:hypothetical protein
VSTYLNVSIVLSTPRKAINVKDEFWAEVYDAPVKWGIHEDYTYDLCFAVVRRKFKRLRGVVRFV